MLIVGFRLSIKTPKLPASERPPISPSRVAVRAQVQLHWGQVMSVLVSQLGDLQRADAALREAAEGAVELWPHEGAPTAPKAWLLRAARRKAIDQYRRELRHQQKHDQILSLSDGVTRNLQADSTLADMRLQLMLSCTHPVLELRVRVALLLHCVCGLDAAQIAQATQVSEISLAQQLARAKKRLRGVSGAFLMPSPDNWLVRRDSLLEAVQGVYRSGHLVESQKRRGANLCELGLWLSQLLLKYRVDDSEVNALASLLLMTQACDAGRLGLSGEVLMPEEQNSKLWDRSQIARAMQMLEHAVSQGTKGPQLLQACIASEQICAIATERPVEWSEVLNNYQALYTFWPTSAVALNAAVALSKTKGPREGLAALEQLASKKDFRVGVSFYNAQAEMLNKLGQRSAAREALIKAIDSPQISEQQRRTVQRQLTALGGELARRA